MAPHTATNTGPRRYIFNDQDMAHFIDSPVMAELLKVTTVMGKSCAGVTTFQYDPQTPLEGLSPPMAVLHGALSAMRSWIVEIPPLRDAQARFGNPAFRDWHRRIVQRAPSIITAILKAFKEYQGCQNYTSSILEACAQEGIVATSVGDENNDDSLDPNERSVVQEMSVYLESAFGHPIRLDYGTGHECSFQVLLYSLCKIGCFGSTPQEPPTAERLKAITLSIWPAYLAVTRTIQTDYMLEPAGSHGVWGLDDYHCLPFYFGACQLQADGEDFRPSSIHDSSVLAMHSSTFLYFGCISYIKSLKKNVPFFESSPMLNDISQLPTWQKVASGLLRLFEGEVLRKRQVVQHFMFGQIFQANWTPSESPRTAPEDTFRPSLGGLPMARAPWADTRTTRPDTGAPGTPPHITKAPWAK